MERVVILGAGYGGLTCALRLANRRRGEVEITLIDASDRFVERIRLHQQAASSRPPTHELARLVRGTGIRLKIGRASALDPVRRIVTVGNEIIAWDKLVLALGSRVDTSTVAGVQQHAHTLDADRAAELAHAIEALEGTRGRVVIVGGGLTGIESATELAERHPNLRITLVTHGRVGEEFSPAARDHLLRTFARLNIRVEEGVRVREVLADRVETDGAPIAFDVCVWAVGFAFPKLPREAGLAVDARGRVSVDARLRSISHPEVYVVGDLAAPIEKTGQQLPMGCKTAQPTGAHAAENLARRAHGAPERPFDWALPMYCVSLGRRDGLIQFARPDGSPTGSILTGRAAALFKELVCRSTMWAMKLERRRIAATSWKRTGRANALTTDSPKLLGSP